MEQEEDPIKDLPRIEVKVESWTGDLREAILRAQKGERIVLSGMISDVALLSVADLRELLLDSDDLDGYLGKEVEAALQDQGEDPMIPAQDVFRWAEIGTVELDIESVTTWDTKENGENNE